MIKIKLKTDSLASRQDAALESFADELHDTRIFLNNSLEDTFINSLLLLMEDDSVLPVSVLEKTTNYIGQYNLKQWEFILNSDLIYIARDRDNFKTKYPRTYKLFEELAND